MLGRRANTLKGEHRVDMFARIQYSFSVHRVQDRTTITWRVVLRSAREVAGFRRSCVTALRRQIVVPPRPGHGPRAQRDALHSGDAFQPVMCRVHWHMRAHVLQ
jgi:hypothetical protein